MQIRNFKIIISTTVIILVLAIISLSTLLYVHGPRVRLVTFERDPANTSLQENSNINITFDRPIKDEDYTSKISFFPEIAFSSQTSSQSITLTLKENFKHNTQYTLKIDNEVYDQTGRKMNEDYIKNFVTGEPNYVYIERNYYDLNTQDTANDHVKIAQLGDVPRIIFSHPEIIMFSANSEYVVVAAKEDDFDQLYTINLKDNSVRKEQMKDSSRIATLSLSKFGETALFSTVPDIRYVGTDNFQENAYRLERLNVEKGEIEIVKDDEGFNVKAYTIDLDKYGQVALVQDELQNFFAVSPFGDFDPILLGQRTDTFGFSSETNQILFRENDRIFLYDIASGESDELDLGTSDFIIDIYKNSSEIYFSYNNFSPAEILSFVEKKNVDNNLSSIILWDNRQKTDKSLTDFSISYDGVLLALNQIPKNCVFDNVGANNQCKDSETTIYDSVKKEEVTKFRGIDLQWLP